MSYAINRRDFLKSAAVGAAALMVPQAIQATTATWGERDVPEYVHPKLGEYKSHKIFRVMTPAWANPAMDPDGNLIWPQQLMTYKPMWPHYDNMIVEYEKGFDVYFKRNHNPLANSVVSKMSGVELHKYARYMKSRVKSIFVFHDQDMVFFWGQRHRNANFSRNLKLL